MSVTNFAVAINNIATTVATAYTAGSGKLYVVSTTGITLTGSQWVRVSMFRSGFPLSILKATAVGSDGGGAYLTIGGAADGYTDVNLLVGDAAELRVTAGAFNDLATAVNNLENAPPPTTSIPSMSDTSAANNTLYFSTTSNMLSYKNSGGIISQLLTLNSGQPLPQFTIKSGTISNMVLGS